MRQMYDEMALEAIACESEEEKSVNLNIILTRKIFRYFLVQELYTKRVPKS